MWLIKENYFFSVAISMSLDIILSLTQSVLIGRFNPAGFFIVISVLKKMNIEKFYLIFDSEASCMSKEGLYTPKRNRPWKFILPLKKLVIDYPPAPPPILKCSYWPLVV